MHLTSFQQLNSFYTLCTHFDTFQHTHQSLTNKHAARATGKICAVIDRVRGAGVVEGTRAGAAMRGRGSPEGGLSDPTVERGRPEGTTVKERVWKNKQIFSRNLRKCP